VLRFIFTQCQDSHSKS